MGMARVGGVGGRPVFEVPADTVAATFKITEDNYTGQPFGLLEWRAAVRQMERVYGQSYKL